MHLVSPGIAYLPGKGKTGGAAPWHELELGIHTKLNSKLAHATRLPRIICIEGEGLATVDRQHADERIERGALGQEIRTVENHLP